MYGAELHNYSSVSISFQSCFDILLGGGDFEEMKRVADLGTTVFYWSLIVLGLMLGMNIIITSTCGRVAASCLPTITNHYTSHWNVSTVLMGGFERANTVTDAAAPTFSEFLYYIFQKFAPESAVRSLSERRLVSPKGRLQQAVKLVTMNSPGREPSPSSLDPETSIDARSAQPSLHDLPETVENIRAELRELRGPCTSW